MTDDVRRHPQLYEINAWPWLDAVSRREGRALTLGAVQDVLEVALGGMPLTTTVEGLERYSINLRYDRDFRENLEALREIIVPTHTGAQVPLGQLAKVEVVRAPMGIKSEAAVPNAWIYVDVKNIDVGTYVQMAMRAVNEAIAKGTVKLPSGYNIFWSGQYEYMLRAKQRLMIVVPLCFAIIFVLHLWLGIYQSGEPAEWPWSYMFLAIVMFLFALHAAGRSLGVDAWLRRHVPAVRDGTGLLGKLLKAAG
jgi:Cu(I)/Ag(I) efflux system membrane protein CusA/SilA